MIINFKNYLMLMINYKKNQNIIKIKLNNKNIHLDKIMINYKRFMIN